MRRFARVLFGCSLTVLMPLAGCDCGGSGDQDAGQDASRRYDAARSDLFMVDAVGADSAATLDASVPTDAAIVDATALDVTTSADATTAADVTAAPDVTTAADTAIADDVAVPDTWTEPDSASVEDAAPADAFVPYDAGAGEACGTLSVQGECVGELLRYCNSSNLVEVIDCASDATFGGPTKTCGLVDCVDSDCFGYWCVQDLGESCDYSDANTSCDIEADVICQGGTCVQSVDCDVASFVGSCTDDLWSECVLGAVFTVDCGAGNIEPYTCAVPLDATTSPCVGEVGGACGSHNGIDYLCAAGLDCVSGLCRVHDGIAEVRAAGDATGLSLPVVEALVTYLKPEVGNAGAGFFVQADLPGPALYVKIDPATLNPVPLVGDSVSFTVTETDVAEGQQRVVALSNWIVHSSGNDVLWLVQDASEWTDLVSAVGDYESEYLWTTVTMTGDFAASGVGHVAAKVDTAGVTNDSNLELRIPSALYAVAVGEHFGLEPGCVLTTLAPLWRFNALTQVSAWVGGGDIWLDSCPVPRVVQAYATSATTVEVVFNRALDPTSVAFDGSQFGFDNGLSAVGAAPAPEPHVVIVSTTAQVVATTYVVTVTGGVTDFLGAEIGSSDNTASFGDASGNVHVDSVDYPVIAHGARLVIAGSHFAATDSVTVGGVAQPVQFDTDTQLTVPVLDDTTPLGSQQLVVTAATGERARLDVTVIHLVISESDADTPGTDVAEFVEIAAGVPEVTLAGYTVVFFNGSDSDRSYRAIELASGTNAHGLMVLGNTGVVPRPAFEFPSNGLQNGQDAIAIYQASADSFPNGTGVTATRLIDALVYDTGQADDDGLLTVLLGLGPERVQVDESANANGAEDAIFRCGAARLDGRVFLVGAPTPGQVNICP